MHRGIPESKLLSVNFWSIATQTPNPLTGEIRFAHEMINAYSEVTYDREKGLKILSRIPKKDRELAFEADDALRKNFDFLCVVDTNTRIVNGKNISVVAIVTFKNNWMASENGLQGYWKFDVPICLEYIEIKLEPENFGWAAALQHLEMFNYITRTHKVGMVVDSDLGNINNYNQMKKPIIEPDYLPHNVQLMYASADAGKENIVNKSLSIADSVSSQCLNALLSGKAPFNEKRQNNDLFEGLRIIRPKQ